MMKRKSDNWEFSWVGAQSLAEVQEALPNKMQLLRNPAKSNKAYFWRKITKVSSWLKSELTFCDFSPKISLFDLAKNM